MKNSRNFNRYSQPQNNTRNAEKLLGYRDCFEKQYRQLYHWEDARADGNIISRGYPVYDKTLLRFVNDAYDSGLLLSNYRQIIDAYGLNDVDLLIDRGDITAVRAVLTYYIRNEHYQDGLWGRAIRKKCFLRILDRLEEMC